MLLPIITPTYTYRVGEINLEKFCSPGEVTQNAQK
jgi:hypothetical protein